jgi:NAD(P)-dependent dehydrogenase (short-subunit alcohol dehydrogenase family)
MKPFLRAALVAVVALLPGVGTAEQPGRPTVLITGASRGIGLELARQYAARDWRVIATARDPATASDLQKLAATDPDVVVETLDVTDHAGVDALAAKYRDQPVDLLLLNAAQGPTPQTAVRSLAKLDFAEARQSFEVNAIGPMKVAQAFVDRVAASSRKLIVAISSDSGSLEASVELPILYNYKASKAALNMYMHTLSFETPRKGITVVMLHPGTVKTNPGLIRLPGALETPDAVGRMVAVIDKLTPADNGRFLDNRGETMPW